ncbi:MAG: eCIS core domain-containing protein [Candidatus Promineifilaceae bacterium]
MQKRSRQNEFVAKPDQNDLGFFTADRAAPLGSSIGGSVDILRSLDLNKRHEMLGKLGGIQSNAHIGRIVQRLQTAEDNETETQPTNEQGQITTEASIQREQVDPTPPTREPSLLQRTLQQYGYQLGGNGSVISSFGVTEPTVSRQSRQPAAQPRSVVSAPVIQAKLTVNEVNDPFEQEADRVADQVMRMPAPPAEAPPAETPPDEKNNQKGTGRVQRSAENDPMGGATVNNDVESRVGSLDGRGEPLSESSQEFFGSRMGADFSDVRIHRDASSAELSTDLNARAFTVGNNIAFNSGEYNPDTPDGKRLLAHELTHTVQQGASAQVQRKAIVTDEGTCPVCGKKGKIGSTCGGCGKKFESLQLQRKAATNIPILIQRKEVGDSIRPKLPTQKSLKPAKEAAAPQQETAPKVTANDLLQAANVPLGPVSPANISNKSSADQLAQRPTPKEPTSAPEPVNVERASEGIDKLRAGSDAPQKEGQAVESQEPTSSFDIQAVATAAQELAISAVPKPQIDKPSIADFVEAPQEESERAVEVGSPTEDVDKATTKADALGSVQFEQPPTTPPMAESVADSTNDNGGDVPDFSGMSLSESVENFQNNQDATQDTQTPRPSAEDVPAVQPEVPTPAPVGEEVAPSEDLQTDGVQVATDVLQETKTVIDTVQAEKPSLEIVESPEQTEPTPLDVQPMQLADVMNRADNMEPEARPVEASEHTKTALEKPVLAEQPEKSEQPRVEQPKIEKSVSLDASQPNNKDKPARPDIPIGAAAEKVGDLVAEKELSGELDQVVKQAAEGEPIQMVQRTPDIQRGLVDVLIPDWVKNALKALRDGSTTKEGEIDADGTTTESEIEVEANTQGAVIEADGASKGAEVDNDGTTKSTELTENQTTKATELEGNQEEKATELETAQEEQSTELEAGQQEQTTELEAAEEEQTTELEVGQEEQGATLDNLQEEQGTELDVAQQEQAAELEAAQMEQGEALKAVQNEQEAELEAAESEKSAELESDVANRETTLQNDAEGRYAMLETDAAQKASELDLEAANQQVMMQGELDALGAQATAEEEGINSYVETESTALGDETTAATGELEGMWATIEVDADSLIGRLDAEAGRICEENQAEADAFLTRLDPFVEDAQKAWAGVKKAAATRWNKFIESVTIDLSFLDGAFKTFNKYATQLWDGIKTRAADFAIKAGVQIGKAISWAMTAWDELSQLWNNTEAYLKERATQAREWIVQKSDDAREWVAQKADDARQWIVEKAEAANVWIGEKATQAKEFIVDQAENARTTITEVAESVRVLIADKAEQARVMIGEAADSARTFIGETAETARTFIREKQTIANEWIGGKADDARTFISEKQTVVNEWIGGKADAANEWIGSKQTDATTWIGAQTDAAQAWIDGRASQVAEAFQAAGQGLVTGLSSRARAAVSAVSSEGGPIAKFFGSIVNSLISGVERIGSSVVNLASKGLSWGLGKVEGLASSAVQFVGTASTNAVNFVGDTASTAVSGVAATATGAVNLVGETATTSVNFVEQRATGAVDSVANTATGVVNNVESKATGAVNYVEEKATGAANYVEDKAVNVVNTTEGLAQGAVNVVEGVATGAVNGVEGISKNVVNRVATTATNQVNRLETTAAVTVSLAQVMGTGAVNLIEEYGPNVVSFAKQAWEATKTAFWNSTFGGLQIRLAQAALPHVTSFVSGVMDQGRAGITWVNTQVDSAKQWLETQMPGLMACWELYQSFAAGIEERLRQLPLIGDFIRASEAITQAIDQMVEGALLGDLIKDPTGWNIVGQIIMGFIPIAGQIADIRDLIAVLDKMERGEATYLDLTLALIAFIPGLGDAGKATKNLDQAPEMLKFVDELGGLFGDLPKGLTRNILDNPALKEAITKNPQILETLLKQGDEGIELLAKHGEQGIRVLEEYGDEGLRMLREGVYSVVEGADGHLYKVLADGRMVRCSKCDLVRKQFAELLSRNKKLADQLDEIDAIADPVKKAEALAAFEKTIESAGKSDAIKRATDMYKNGATLEEVMEELGPKYSWVAHTRHGVKVEKEVLDALGVASQKSKVTVQIPVKGKGTISVDTVPDYIDGGVLGEIKSGNNVGYTPQIRAQIEYVKQQKSLTQYVLWISKDAKNVDQRLFDLADDAQSPVIIKYIEDLVKN